MGGNGEAEMEKGRRTVVLFGVRKMVCLELMICIYPTVRIRRKPCELHGGKLIGNGGMGGCGSDRKDLFHVADTMGEEEVYYSLYGIAVARICIETCVRTR
jgi:hypothetical protein